MLLRVSRMADDLPQIANELELNPVLARSDGAQAIDGRVRLQAAEPTDAYLSPAAITHRSAAPGHLLAGAAVARACRL